MAVRQQMAKWREEVEQANDRIEELEGQLKVRGRRLRFCRIFARKGILGN